MVILTGKRTSLAPLAAASWILLRAWAMFLSLSGVTVIWHNAIINYTPFINKNKKKEKKHKYLTRERDLPCQQGEGAKEEQEGPLLVRPRRRRRKPSSLYSYCHCRGGFDFDESNSSYYWCLVWGKILKWEM